MSSNFFRKKTDPMLIPAGGPAAAPTPSREIYARMGEASIKAMLRDFYTHLAKSPIAEMFSADLEAASEKSALFFIGLLGGPPLYMEKFGPPRMRMRHLPFRITEEHRKVWLECFLAVLEKPETYQFPPEHLAEFKAFLDAFSHWMVNTQDSLG